MKRTILATILIITLAFCLTACGCEHEWKEATCTAPKTCNLCEKTEGEIIDHQWEEANCEEPKTCKGCGLTEGTAIGHSWKEATCTDPKTCEICKKTDGKSLGHDLTEPEIVDPSLAIATCTYVQKCTVCGQEFSEKGTMTKLHDGEYFLMNPLTFAHRLQILLQEMQDLINDNEYITFLNDDQPRGNLQMYIASMDPAGNIEVPGTFEFSSHNSMIQISEKLEHNCFYAVAGDVSGAQHAALTLVSILRTADPTLEFEDAQQYVTQLLQNRTLELNGICYGIAGNDKKLTIIVAVGEMAK